MLHSTRSSRPHPVASWRGHSTNSWDNYFLPSPLLLVGHEDADLAPHPDVPELQGQIVAAGGQQLAIRGEGDGVNLRVQGLADEPAYLPPRRHVPQLDRVDLIDGRQPLAVG